MNPENFPDVIRATLGRDVDAALENALRDAAGRRLLPHEITRRCRCIHFHDGASTYYLDGVPILNVGPIRCEKLPDGTIQIEQKIERP